MDQDRTRSTSSLEDICIHRKNNPCQRTQQEFMYTNKNTRNKSKRIQKKCWLEIQDAQIEKWLEKTGRFPKKRWKISQKRALKNWFERLDKDGSGEIDADELADPLLSTGLARTMSEVTDLVKTFDDNDSSGIDFEEFLSVMNKESKQGTKNAADGGSIAIDNNDLVGGGTRRCRNDSVKVNSKCKKQDTNADNFESVSSNPIAEFTRRQRSEQMDLKTILSQERRKLLLHATMIQAEKRDLAFDQIISWRAELKTLDGPPKFRMMTEITRLGQMLEADRENNDGFVDSIKEILYKLKLEGT
jgi:Ca2+-binding protein (EF-Hand superfamily)